MRGLSTHVPALLLCVSLVSAFPQIRGDWSLRLTGDGAVWSASSDGVHLPSIRVPGDVISALSEAGIIADPWHDLTWRDQAGRWDLVTWTFSTVFESPPWLANGTTLLVFDSVKMAGDISLNGHSLGAATSQHLRYSWDVTALLSPGKNVLNVTFPPTVGDTRNDGGRFQGCSGGWDWAPYSNETTGRTPKGIRTMSKGVVGPVYLTHVGDGSAFITAVKPLVHYTGIYPSTPLPGDGGPATWRVDVLVYLLSPGGAAAGAPLRVAPEWGTPVTVSAPALPAGIETAVNVSITVPARTVSLWWPNTVSASRPLYSVIASYNISAAAVFVGFRTLALVTSDDSVPSALAGVHGSGNLTFRIKVNGADLALRGANWIPLEELSSRLNGSSEAASVASAAAAGMSMLRVWGGGVYPSDALLTAADRYGLLLYVDAMYASQSDSHHFAADTVEQRAELTLNVRQLASHPSVALYDQCNECGGSGDFVKFVGPTIAGEDPTRPIWPSSPSSGWEDGVDRLWGTPLAGATLAIRTVPAPVAPVNSGCTGQSGAFYDGFPVTPFFAPLPVKDAAACCALCAATPPCAIGNYAAGGCQLVAPPAVPVPAAASSMAVFPAGSTLTPMPVPLPVSTEVHGPYLGGGGWPTVNGNGPPARAYDPGLPPVLSSAPASTYGVSAPGVFTSEFGVGQPASFEIISSTLSAEFWGMHGGANPPDTCTAGFNHVCTGGNVMAQRNYGCDDAWISYFPAGMSVTLDDSGAAPFSAQLYLCQLATTLALQSAVEKLRSTNRWGALTWQLGEVWPTYGWGSLEYSSGAGSVPGGRWKPSHYMLARGFGNVAAACGADGACYVKNDDAWGRPPLQRVDGGPHHRWLRGAHGVRYFCHRHPERRRGAGCCQHPVACTARDSQREPLGGGDGDGW